MSKPLLAFLIIIGGQSFGYSLSRDLITVETCMYCWYWDDVEFKVDPSRAGSLLAGSHREPPTLAGVIQGSCLFVCAQK